MADVSKIDIDGVQWNIKDEYLRNYVLPVNGFLKEYIRNQFFLTAPTNIQGGTSEATAITAQYDGYVTLYGGGDGNPSGRGIVFYIKYKNTTEFIKLADNAYTGGSHHHENFIIIPITKGDTFYASKNSNIYQYYAQWYIYRDTTGR